MAENEKEGFRFAKGSTSILKGVEPDNIGMTGTLASVRTGAHTGETGVLNGSVPPNVYNTVYNYEGEQRKKDSNASKIIIVTLVVALLVVAAAAALRVAGVF